MGDKQDRDVCNMPGTIGTLGSVGELGFSPQVGMGWRITSMETLEQPDLVSSCIGEHMQVLKEWCVLKGA